MGLVAFATLHVRRVRREKRYYDADRSAGRHVGRKSGRDGSYTRVVATEETERAREHDGAFRRAATIPRVLRRFDNTATAHVIPDSVR